MSDSDVRAHLRSVIGWLGGDGPLPPHHRPAWAAVRTPSGASTAASVAKGDEVVTDHAFEVRHSGAPGIAHGSAVATVVDDVLGTCCTSSSCRA